MALQKSAATQLAVKKEMVMNVDTSTNVVLIV